MFSSTIARVLAERYAHYVGSYRYLHPSRKAVSWCRNAEAPRVRLWPVRFPRALLSLGVMFL